MKLINEAIKQKKINSKQLPELLREEISELKEIILKYNMALDEYEKEEEEDKGTEKQLDDMENFIATKDQELANEIKAYEPPAAPVPAAAAAATPPENKEDNSIGWLIFGGVVIVATLGLVNVFKKK